MSSNVNNVLRDENGKELGEFRVGELFDMKLGMQVKDMSNTGELRVITGNTMTHGIAGYVNEELDSRFVFEDKITVAMRGQGGKCYYQKGKFLAGHNSMVLLPKDAENFNDSTANYIVSALNKLPFSGYSNYPTLSTYGNYTILLPLTPTNTPDWEYMESYISTIEHKYLNTVKALNDKEMRLLQELYGASGDLHIQEPEHGYDDFEVGSILEVENLKFTHPSTLIEGGNTPYVTRTASNNGLTKFVEEHSDFVYTNGKVITLGAETVEFFYQPYDSFVVGNKMYSVNCKNMSQEIAMYIITAAEKATKGFFSYNNGLTGTKFKKCKISLPKTSENTPDWEYMEKYISIIAQRERERESPNISLQNRANSQTANFNTLKEFSLKDVFTIAPTKKLKLQGANYIKDDEITSVDGVTPYIAAISTNNGIKGFSSFDANNTGNVITLSTTADSSSTVFYQETHFIGRQQIAEIRLNGDKLNRQIAMYVIAFVKHQASLFNYSNKLTTDKLGDFKIELPVGEDGNIAWHEVERFIAGIEYKERESRQIYHYKTEQIIDALINKKN